MNLSERIDLFLEKTKGNAWHDDDGKFIDKDELVRGSYSKDGAVERARRQGGDVGPRKSPAMGACGRKARKSRGDVRCVDGARKDRLG